MQKDLVKLIERYDWRYRFKELDKEYLSLYEYTEERYSVSVGLYDLEDENEYLKYRDLYFMFNYRILGENGSWHNNRIYNLRKHCCYRNIIKENLPLLSKNY